MSLRDEAKSTTIVAIDTGGTFTDFLLHRRGHLTALKVPSTPEDPAAAVLAGLERLFPAGLPPDTRVIHGSTVATNALLERKGARVGLVTNAGLEDVVEIARQDRPDLYALSGSRSPPLVRREDRFGIRGRLHPDGGVRAPLDRLELDRLPELLEGAESVAVVLLHSYANGAHEARVARALAGLGVPISLSSRILPEFREYERTSTTVANAYVAPRMARYLGDLGRRFGEGRIRVMGSNGGALSLGRAVAEPVHTVLSGPAGGVVGALEWGRRCDCTSLLSLDMGGTSTDVSLIPGTLLQTREGAVGGLPIAIPLLDIHTVGAGGGSIARIDPGGVLRVGPDSAGAVPGPVSYGAGGTDVTVTDAHLWLGRLPPRGLLGGGRPLDREAVGGPLRALAVSAGMAPQEIASGIIDVVNTAMEGALRVISVERGIDPSDFALLAFGGAAGLHAAELAQRVGLGRVIIPPEPGLLSAFGMLVSPVLLDRSRTVLLSSEDPAAESEVGAALDELEAVARRELSEEGFDGTTALADRWVDARYQGQSFELRVPGEGWIERFHEAHESRYGYRREDTPVEAVTLRSQLRVEAPALHTPRASAQGDSTHPHQSVLVGSEAIPVAVHERSALPPGEPIEGPLILTEYSSTTWCPPNWVAVRDPRGVLHLHRRGSTRVTR